MLRPTESRILWLQQFGRGLRKTKDDKKLTVIDSIGNHRTFLLNGPGVDEGSHPDEPQAARAGGHRREPVGEAASSASAASSHDATPSGPAPSGRTAACRQPLIIGLDRQP